MDIEKDPSIKNTKDINFSNDFATISNNELTIHNEANNLVIAIPTLRKIFVKKERTYYFSILSIIISLLIIVTTTFFFQDNTIVMIIAFTIATLTIALGFFIKKHRYHLIMVLKEEVKGFPIKKKSKQNAILISNKIMKYLK
jgi:hypothetical protein